MKRHGRFAPVFAILLMAAVSLFAKDSRDVRVAYEANVGGTTIAPGQYRLRWDTKNADPEITLLKGRKVVAKARGQWVDRNVEYNQNSVLYDTQSGGSRSILEMRFEGSSKVLVFGGDSTAQGHSGSAPSTESAPAAPSGKPGKAGDKTSSIRFLGKPTTAAHQYRAAPQSPDPIVGFRPNFKLPVFPATADQLVRRPYSW